MKMWLPLLAAAALVTIQAPAQAQTPERVAKQCVEAIDEVVERCANAAAQETRECVQLIRRLLRAGRERAARQVAERCIRSATTRTENCVERVHQICRRCINFLVEVGETQLARRVHNACKEAVSDIRSFLQREKAAIRAAFSN